MDERRLVQISKLLSAMFSPLYAPLWVFVGMFTFSYLMMLPMSYKLSILFMVWVFCVLIPRLGVNIFRIIKQMTHWQLSHREHRHMPYIITLLSFATCLAIMIKFNVPTFIRGVVLASLVAQILCTIINAWWKISTHMVGMGGLVGALIAFSLLFYFNPLLLLCILLLLSGAVGTARIILRQHSLSQVFAGFVLGFFVAVIFIMMSWF